MAQAGKRAPINLQEVEKLAALQCTDEEIAGWFNVSVRTIERRKKNSKFRAAMERGRAKGKISIRRMQMRMLEEGNSTMGIWLGKQVLGQNDQGPSVTPSTSIILLPALDLVGDNTWGCSDSTESFDESPSTNISESMGPVVEIRPTFTRGPFTLAASEK
ncbi:MAG: hypothetical protein ABI972_21295 [Acidobacteriota bacterium]